MRNWSASCVLLLAPLVVSAGMPKSISGFFVSTPQGWIARGGDVSARFSADSLQIGPHRLVHEDALAAAPTPVLSGLVRRYSGQAAAEARIAESVWYRGIYAGIDLVFRFEGRTLKSEYLVAPGNDPAAIRFRYSGASSVSLEGGDLIVDGVREAAPVAWQDGPAGRSYIRAEYRLQRDVVSFELGSYDPGLPLTIDPYVVATWGFHGGTTIDNVTALAIDSAGNIYLAGSTESADMIASPLLPRSIGVDAFVIKIDPVQNRVLWATYLGGESHDEAAALAVHPAGGVVLAGFTSSGTFPVKNAYQGTRPSGSHDAFLARLDASGSMVFGTWFGGSGTDKAYGATVTPGGEIWIAGETDSANFPRHLTIFGAARGGVEAFASRFSAAGALLTSTTFGGSATDRARAIAADSVGDVYVTGSTESADFPTVSPFQAASGGGADAFVSKISADGTGFRYSSYLGGPPREVSMPESGTAVAVDSTGAAWVAGIASSLSFPTVSPLQPSYGGGNTDAFLARIDPAGALVYSSYVGGNGSDEAAGLALFGEGSVALAGSTTSTDLPLLDQIAGASGSSWDGFVLVVNSSASSRLLSTYMSGAASDTITALEVRGTSIWVAGNSSSATFLPSGAPRGLIDGYFAELRSSITTVTIGGPAGRVWQVSGTGCEPGTYSGVRTMNWTPGVQCTVTMQAETGADTRHLFASWSDGSIQNPRVFTASPGTWTTTYRTEYLVQTSAGTGGSAVPTLTWIAAGQSVQLTATPSSGYSFLGWSGGIAGNPASVLVTGPVSTVASFACMYSLGSTSASVTSAATTLAVTVSTGVGCAVTATSNVGWIAATVDGLSVSLDIGDNSGSPSRTGTVTIGTATFTVAQSGVTTVAVSFSPPEYRVWEVAGTGCQPGSYTGPGSLTWTAGAQCTVTMHPNLGTTSRQVFSQWSDGSTANPRTFTAAPGSWTASYRTEYFVQTTASNGGTASPVSAWVADGAQAQLTATASAGYTFTGWSGGITGNPAAVTVTAPFTANASFACAYTLGSTSASVSAAATTIVVPVTTGAGCVWTATPNADWIGVSVANGSAQMTLSANGSAARTGTVTIAGQTFTIQQAAAGCSFSLSEDSASAPASGATGTLTVNASAPGCQWTVSSSVSWLTANSTGSSGTAAFGWSAAANTGPARTGTLTVAGRTFTVTQDAVPCTYALTPTSRSAAAAGDSGTVSVVTPSGCAWSATSNAAWITITAGLSGNGNGTVSYSVAANPNAAQRSGTVTIAGQTFTVTQNAAASTGNRFVPVTPCRIADTRNPNGPFGGPAIAGGSSRSFAVPSSPCGIPSTALAYSINVTVVPQGLLGFLTVWPTGQSLPLVSTLNSFDGRVKANAAIVPAGTGGGISVFAMHSTDVILDINGYFVPPANTAALAFYPLTPCRVADTRSSFGALGGPALAGGQERSFPVRSSSCGVPAAAQAYSLNFTAVPRGALGHLTTWPTGGPAPLVSTLNAMTGQVTANAAIVPAGANGSISVYATNETDLVIDINGYFGPAGAGGLSFHNLTPCRALDTREPSGSPPFIGVLSTNLAGSVCGVAAGAQAYALSATVVPTGLMGYLTLWPQGQPQPVVSTLNALDGLVTSNMAIVPTTNGSISSFAANSTYLLLDISGYFAP